MNKYIKKIISGMLVLSMLTSTLITSSAATDVNVSVNVNPKIDIMLTSKDTTLNLDNFETDVKTSLQSKGINANNINFQTIERITTEFDQNNYTASEIKNSWQQIPNPNAFKVYNDIIMNLCNTSCEGLYTYGDNPNTGYYQSFIFQDSYETNYKSISADVITHSCQGAVGFVVSYNKDTDEAYLLVIIDSSGRDTNTAGYAQSVFLCKEKNFSKKPYHTWNATHSVGYPGTNPDVTILKSVNISSMGIPTRTSYQKMADKTKSFHFEIVYKDGVVTAYGPNGLPGLTYDIGKEANAGGMGLYTECNGSFYNISMKYEQINIKTFKNVLTEPTWREDAKHIVVNVDNNIDHTLTSSATIGEILSRTLADDIHFIQWGTNTNKSASETFISRNDNKGLFVDNSNYNNAVEKTAEYIASLVNQESSEQYITIGQDISFSVDPEEYKTNATSIDYPNGRWKINHEYKYFANNQGQSSESGVPTANLNFNFDKPGKYNILFDDKLVKEVYVHRKPVADFTIEIGENNSLKLMSTSYDLDSNEDKGNGAGIAKENWYHKEASASEWIEGKLTEFDKTKIYVIKLEVEDYQGATSYTTKYTGTGNPVSNFNYANNVVSKYKLLIVNNTSYDPEGYEIVEQNWVLKKDGVVVSESSEPVTNFNVDGLGGGNYTYTLTVKNNLGTVSESFTKSFTIEEDYGKPEVAIGQQGCDWKHSQAVSLEFSDNESEFKNWRYAFTTSPVAPATDEEWSTWSEEINSTVQISDVSGKYYLHIQAYDVASNELTRAVGTYNLDNTDPIINNVKTQKDEINKMFIKVEATDEHSGIVGYAITKAKPMTFNIRSRMTTLEEPSTYQESNILEVTDNGTYNVWVKDNTGNITVTTYTIEDVNYIGKNTTVYAEVGCEFKVTIPKHIILSGTTKSGAYTVSVEGDIAGTDKIKVMPDESFALKSTNLNDVTALISQDKTEWSYNQILNDEFKVIGNGAIDAKDMTAGSWNGNFNFNIALEGDKIYKDSEPYVEYMDILYDYEVEETN